MQTPPPSQIEVLRWISLHLAQKLTQSAQNKDWARAAVISSIIKATLECSREIDA